MSQQHDDSTTTAARETAATAAEEGKHLASSAGQQAGQVAQEAADQARGVAREAHSQVAATLEDQTRAQRDRLAETLHTVGQDLDQMSQQSDGLAGRVAGEVAHHSRTVGSYLESREPGQLLGDVRSFARDRPGTFLLGALAAGVVVGRLTRGVAEGVDAATNDGGATGPTGTTGAQPTATGTDTAAVAPVPGPGAALPPAYDAPHGAPTMPPPSLPTQAPITPSTATPTPGEPLPGGGLR
ncbi:hypothetical protein [Nocardioides nanhaiensis]